MALTSFLDVDADSPFSIHNLPYGVFQPAGAVPRVGVAIGDFVLDLAALEQRSLLPTVPSSLFARHTLNPLMAAGPTVWGRVRARLTELLSAQDPVLQQDSALQSAVLLPMADVRLLLPVEIPDYTDFYSSKYHAENVGTMIRGPENALQENWLHLPVAYHGRASSVVISGTEIHRPHGQTGAGKFGPCRALDFELEVGFFIGQGSKRGVPIPISEATQHIFGLVLVNDWSARDIQRWEYVPLGPFLSKSFATSISPWVVPIAALEPFQKPVPLQDPAPLEYLCWQDDFTLDVELQVDLAIAGGTRQPVTRSNFQHLYWSMAQQVAHHTVAGCELRTGDLFASGTVSGPEPESRGCLLERTWRGEQPLIFDDGTRRVFLEDGDEVVMTAYCQGDGYRVGFGEVRGRIASS